MTCRLQAVCRVLTEREEGYDIMDDFNWVGSRHHY